MSDEDHEGGHEVDGEQGREVDLDAGREHPEQPEPPERPEQPERSERTERPAVLLLRALGLGDFLTGVPAYRAVRAAYPDHEIVLAAPGRLAPLVELCGAIDRLLPTGELEPIDWQGAPPELAIDLHGNGSASHRLVEATGAKRVLMYASDAAPDVEGPWWVSDEHEIDRWCRLLEWEQIRADRTAVGIDRPRGVNAPAERVTVVHPGAASAGRRWPADRFADAVRGLIEDGHLVVVTGSADELPLARRVAAWAGLPGDAVLAGRTTLLELAALVSRARLLVSNDTGIAHLAFAYGTPSVTLYGPVSPMVWGPPRGTGTVWTGTETETYDQSTEPAGTAGTGGSTGVRHIALWHGTGGRPGDAHSERVDPRLLKISVSEVVAAARALKGTRSPTLAFAHHRAESQPL